MNLFSNFAALLLWWTNIYTYVFRSIKACWTCTRPLMETLTCVTTSSPSSWTSRWMASRRSPPGSPRWREPDPDLDTTWLTRRSEAKHLNVWKTYLFFYWLDIWHFSIDFVLFNKFSTLLHIISQSVIKYCVTIVLKFLQFVHPESWHSLWIIK